MTKYNITIATQYTMEAEDENDALQKAREQFDKDTHDAITEDGTMTSLMGYNVEEVEE